jgi:sarcosine oxidase subunit delta
MKLMTCPVNGTRLISEFVCWGELRAMPEPTTCSDEAWADHVFNRNGAPGVKTEWWCHTPSNTWFLAERDTEHDRVIRTWQLQGDQA